MAKEFTYKGKTADELQKMGLNELAQIMPAKFRRRIKRGLADGQKKLLEEIKKFKEGKRKKPIKTHYRDLLILPEMFGIKISVHNGKDFVPVEIQPEMVGHALGEFVLTRREVKHKAPGIGATRSSKFISVK